MMKKILLYIAACALMLTGCVKDPKTVHVSSVSLDQTEITILEGESTTLTASVLPADAADKSVNWTSSDQNVATVSASGEVTAVAEGTATITVTTCDGGKTATCKVLVNHVEPGFMAEAVQLWEDGPFWATCNVGAESPEESGLYFSWGNVIGYAPEDDVFTYSFDKDNYSKTPGADLDGYIPAYSYYDAARANMGTKWRIPTAEEFEMLVNAPEFEKTTVEWETLNGVKGIRVYGKGDYSDRSIFLPAASYVANTNLIELEPESGLYWTSTDGVEIDEEGNRYAYCIYGTKLMQSLHYPGMPVRAVMNESDYPDPESFTISFDMNGHGAAVAGITGIKPGAKIEKPADPEEEGYEFIGWFKDKRCAKEWDFDSCKVTDTITLYAKWIPAGSVTGRFTVNAQGKQVYFSNGNLFWNGSSFGFEETQTAFSPNFYPDHVSYFGWSKDASVSCSEDDSYPEVSDKDVLFTNQTLTTANPDFIANGQKGIWRTLSIEELNYMLKTRRINADDWSSGYGYTCVWTTVNSVQGLIIFYDGYDGQRTNLSEIPEGCAFLPAAGYMSGLSVLSSGDYGHYWTPGLEKGDAVFFRFFEGMITSSISFQNYYRCPIRLVADCEQ